MPSNYFCNFWLEFGLGHWIFWTPVPDTPRYHELIKRFSHTFFVFVLCVT